MTAPGGTGPGVVVLPGGRVEFRLADPGRQYHRVRLDAGLGSASPRPELTWTAGTWSVQVDLPPLLRVEYAFEVTHTALDPAATSVVRSAQGDRSVLELPGYREPDWLSWSAPEGTVVDLDTGATGVHARVWAADGLDPATPAPLLLVHDGDDYAAQGRLTHYLAGLVRDGLVPPMRAVLVTVEPRDLLFAASDDYASWLVDDLLPLVRELWPSGPVVAVGAGLGALAALHAQWRHPGTFAGLLLQSGTFFTPETDPQEVEHPQWPAITRFVAVLLLDDATAQLPRIALTCGTHEESAANNLLLAQRLHELGVVVTHTEVADLHNPTSWRDALDPALADLLVAVTRP